MVVKMGSPESNSSAAAETPLAADLCLPLFEATQREHWPSAMSWTEAVRHFETARADYMRQFDSPEARWRAKNPVRFSLVP